MKKDLKLFENRKTKGRKSLSEKKLYLHQGTVKILFTCMEKDTIFTPGATLTKLYHTLSISASQS